MNPTDFPRIRRTLYLLSYARIRWKTGFEPAPYRVTAYHSTAKLPPPVPVEGFEPSMNYFA